MYEKAKRFIVFFIAIVLLIIAVGFFGNAISEVVHDISGFFS